MLYLTMGNCASRKLLYNYFVQLSGTKLKRVYGKGEQHRCQILIIGGNPSMVILLLANQDLTPMLG